MSNLTAAELDQLYTKANTADEKLFAEMRSNILLVSGDHYNKRGSRFWNRIRSTKELTDGQRLRLTKNHTATICGIITGNILSNAPNVMPVPNNEDEIQDQKTAELNKSVWDYMKQKMKFRSKLRCFAENFTQFGEVHAKIYWDVNKGDVMGYQQKVDMDDQPMYDEYNKPTPDKNKPVYSGEMCIEEVFGFNLLRCPHSQNLHESPYYIVRKMTEKSVVKDMLRGDEKANQKWEAITSNEENSYLVFDGESGNYESNKSEVLVREHYYRPCIEYPNGYFFFATRDVIIAEGPLPYGVWPFASAGYNKIPTSPRYRSPIKQMRPYQIEINRSASAIATAQVTLGDDKLVMPNGSRISDAGKLPGVRGISVAGGADPKILPGRGGDQYLPYMQSQIKEMYEVMNVFEDNSTRDGQLDQYALLYQSMRNKKKFKKYAEEFEDFVKEIARITLELARHYLEEYHIIPMIGKSEVVNIMEFKHSDKNKFRFDIEAVSDDVDTMLGKQLAINHTLQYVGNTLERSDIGKMIRAMPFVNYEEAYGDLTLDYDMSKNDMLAMERGEQPIIGPYDNHTYLINRAVNRMKKPDFRFLPPQIQQLYQQYVLVHQQAETENQLKIQRAQSGYIPTDGPLVKVDMYVNDAEGDTVRARMPQRALEWLDKQLAAQGTSLAKLMDMNEGAVAQMAEQMPQGQAPQQGALPLR
jgi:hypothetical protein